MKIRRSKLYNETLGCYYPSFFSMEIDTNAPMSNFDLQKVSYYEQSVFFHEYIHFMQDFMTTSGLYNIYCINETFRDIATNNATRNPFLVPVQESENVIIRVNNTINRMTFGGDSDYDYIEIKNIHTEPYSDDDFMSVKMQPVELILLETNHGIIQFGRREIMESMAFVLEQLCTRGYDPAPEYPYSTAEKMARFVCHNGFEDSLLNVLALCDISLMTQNPGATFFNYLNRIVLEEISVQKAEDLYDDFYAKNGKDYYGNIKSTLQDYDEKLCHAKEALKSYINQNEISAQLDQWIDLIFDTGKTIRHESPYFFINMARNGYFAQNRIFANLVRLVGSPLIKNKKGEYGYFPSTPDYGGIFQYLTAIESVYNIFYGEFACSLYDFCVQSEGKSKIKVNDYCKSSPWRRCMDAELCPVAMVMRHRRLYVNPPIEESEHMYH